MNTASYVAPFNPPKTTQFVRVQQLVRVQTEYGSRMQRFRTSVPNYFTAEHTKKVLADVARAHGFTVVEDPTP